MSFFAVACKRYSVLDYEQKPVEPEKINRILQAGLVAPTACNNQPQRILLIESEEDKEKLRTVVPSKYDFPAALLICYDRHACWKRPFDGKESGEIDASIVATHMMLEATDLNLGSIWVMYWDPEQMKRAFDLPEHIEPVSLLIIGYPSEKASPRSGHAQSKPLSEILL